ncbi:MAG: hypothetical protein OEW75_01915, partial [Cyclobacteriaceae bacterium]|nr:hypothetical protein [Cyclobacteriaceae bacterium]
MKKVQIILIFTFIASFNIEAQNLDSILLNETRLQRPLTNHKGQLRVDFKYSYGFSNTAFNSNAERLSLQEKGVNSIEQKMDMNFKYGLSENLQIGWYLSYISFNESEPTRYRQEWITTQKDNNIEENYLNVNRGLTDWLVQLDYNFRNFTNPHDFVLSFGALLPVGKKNYQQPIVTFEDTPDYFPTRDDYTLDVTTFSPVGKGVVHLNFEMSSKLRFEKSAINLQAGHSLPGGSTQINNWYYNMQTDSSILYHEYSTRVRPQNKTFLTASYERQLFPWFNVNLGYSAFFLRSGWGMSE